MDMTQGKSHLKALKDLDLGIANLDIEDFEEEEEQDNEEQLEIEKALHVARFKAMSLDLKAHEVNSSDPEKTDLREITVEILTLSGNDRKFVLENIKPERFHLLLQSLSDEEKTKVLNILFPSDPTRNNAQNQTDFRLHRLFKRNRQKKRQPATSSLKIARRKGDVLSDNEEEDVEKIPHNILERIDNAPFIQPVRKLMYAYGGSTHPSKYGALIITDHVKDFVQAWIKVQKKWTIEQMRLLFPELYKCYERSSKCRDFADAAITESTDKVGGDGASVEKEKDDVIDDSSRAEKVEIQAEVVIDVLPTVQFQIYVKEYDGYIGWSTRVDQQDSRTKEMETNEYFDFKVCRDQSILGQKNNRRQDVLKWLDIKGYKLDSKCSKFFNFIMCDRISCIIQITALRRVHAQEEPLDFSAAEYFEFEKAIGILSKLSPPPDAKEILKDYAPKRKQRSKSVAPRKRKSSGKGSRSQSTPRARPQKKDKEKTPRTGRTPQTRSTLRIPKKHTTREAVETQTKLEIPEPINVTKEDEEPLQLLPPGDPRAIEPPPMATVNQPKLPEPMELEMPVMAEVSAAGKKEFMELPPMDNIELPQIADLALIDNIELPPMDNIELPSMENIELPSMENIELPALDNIELPQMAEVTQRHLEMDIEMPIMASVSGLPSVKSNEMEIESEQLLDKEVPSKAGDNRKPSESSGESAPELVSAGSESPSKEALEQAPTGDSAKKKISKRSEQIFSESRSILTKVAESEPADSRKQLAENFIDATPKDAILEKAEKLEINERESADQPTEKVAIEQSIQEVLEPARMSDSENGSTGKSENKSQAIAEMESLQQTPEFPQISSEQNTEEVLESAKVLGDSENDPPHNVEKTPAAIVAPMEAEQETKTSELNKDIMKLESNADEEVLMDPSKMAQGRHVENEVGSKVEETSQVEGVMEVEKAAEASESVEISERKKVDAQVEEDAAQKIEGKEPAPILSDSEGDVAKEKREEEKAVSKKNEEFQEDSGVSKKVKDSQENIEKATNEPNAKEKEDSMEVEEKLEKPKEKEDTMEVEEKLEKPKRGKRSRRKNVSSKKAPTRRSKRGKSVLRKKPPPKKAKKTPPKKRKKKSQQKRKDGKSIGQILNRRKLASDPIGLEVLVRWKGYGPEEDSWEPASGFSDKPAYREYLKSTIEQILDRRKMANDGRKYEVLVRWKGKKEEEDTWELASIFSRMEIYKEFKKNLKPPSKTSKKKPTQKKASSAKKRGRFGFRADDGPALTSRPKRKRAAYVPLLDPDQLLRKPRKPKKSRAKKVETSPVESDGESFKDAEENLTVETPEELADKPVLSDPENMVVEPTSDNNVAASEKKASDAEIDESEKAPEIVANPFAIPAEAPKLVQAETQDRPVLSDSEKMTVEPLSDKNMEVADEPVESKEVPSERVTNPFVIPVETPADEPVLSDPEKMIVETLVDKNIPRKRVTNPFADMEPVREPSEPLSDIDILPLLDAPAEITRLPASPKSDKSTPIKEMVSAPEMAPTKGSPKDMQEDVVFPSTVSTDWEPESEEEVSEEISIEEVSMLIEMDAELPLPTSQDTLPESTSEKLSDSEKYVVPKGMEHMDAELPLPTSQDTLLESTSEKVSDSEKYVVPKGMEHIVQSLERTQKAPEMAPVERLTGSKSSDIPPKENQEAVMQVLNDVNEPDVDQLEAPEKEISDKHEDLFEKSKLVQIQASDQLGDIDALPEVGDVAESEKAEKPLSQVEDVEMEAEPGPKKSEDGLKEDEVVDVNESGENLPGIMQIETPAEMEKVESAVEKKSENLKESVTFENVYDEEYIPGLESDPPNVIVKIFEKNGEIHATCKETGEPLEPFPVNGPIFFGEDLNLLFFPEAAKGNGVIFKIKDDPSLVAEVIEFCNRVLPVNVVPRLLLEHKLGGKQIIENIEAACMECKDTAGLHKALATWDLIQFRNFLEVFGISEGYVNDKVKFERISEGANEVSLLHLTQLLGIDGNAKSLCEKLKSLMDVEHSNLQEVEEDTSPPMEHLPAVIEKGSIAVEVDSAVVQEGEQGTLPQMEDVPKNSEKESMVVEEVKRLAETPEATEKEEIALEIKAKEPSEPEMELPDPKDNEEMVVEEDLEKTDIAESVEPETIIDLPSEKSTDDSTNTPGILEEVEEMVVEEDLEKTKIAESVEPEAILDLPSAKLTDDSTNTAEILEEVEEGTSPIESKAEREKEVLPIKDKAGGEKEASPIEDKSEREKEKVSPPPLKKEVSNPFAIIEEPATLPDVPTKQAVASELVGHEMEEPVLSPKQAKVDAAIEPYPDQVEVAKDDVPKAGLDAEESLDLPEKQTTPPISPNLSSSGFAISPTLSPPLSSGILLPLLDSELLPPLQPKEDDLEDGPPPPPTSPPPSKPPKTPPPNQKSKAPKAKPSLSKLSDEEDSGGEFVILEEADSKAGAEKASTGKAEAKKKVPEKKGKKRKRAPAKKKVAEPPQKRKRGKSKSKARGKSKSKARGKSKSKARAKTTRGKSKSTARAKTTRGKSKSKARPKTTRGKSKSKARPKTSRGKSKSKARAKKSKSKPRGKSKSKPQPPKKKATLLRSKSSPASKKRGKSKQKWEYIHRSTSEFVERAVPARESGRILRYSLRRTKKLRDLHEEDKKFEEAVFFSQLRDQKAIKVQEDPKKKKKLEKKKKPEKPKPKSKSKARSKSRAKSKPKTKPKAKSKSKAKEKPKPKAKAKPKPKAKPKEVEPEKVEEADLDPVEELAEISSDEDFYVATGLPDEVEVDSEEEPKGSEGRSVSRAPEVNSEDEDESPWGKAGLSVSRHPLAREQSEEKPGSEGRSVSRLPNRQGAGRKPRSLSRAPNRKPDRAQRSVSRAPDRKKRVGSRERSPPRKRRRKTDDVVIAEEEEPRRKAAKKPLAPSKRKLAEPSLPPSKRRKITGYYDLTFTFSKELFKRADEIAEILYTHMAVDDHKINKRSRRIVYPNQPHSYDDIKEMKAWICQEWNFPALFPKVDNMERACTIKRTLSRHAVEDLNEILDKMEAQIDANENCHHLKDGHIDRASYYEKFKGLEFQEIRKKVRDQLEGKTQDVYETFLDFFEDIRKVFFRQFCYFNSRHRCYGPVNHLWKEFKRIMMEDRFQVTIEGNSYSIFGCDAFQDFKQEHYLFWELLLYSEIAVFDGPQEDSNESLSMIWRKIRSGEIDSIYGELEDIRENLLECVSDAYPEIWKHQTQADFDKRGEFTEKKIEDVFKRIKNLEERSE